MHWQESSEVEERTAMCGILLENAIVECETYWQESSEIAERKDLGKERFE